MRKCTLLLSVLILVSIYLLAFPTPAQACGGESSSLPSVEHLVSASPVIVRARVLYLDEADRNAIVEVSQYFKGDISLQYLVIEQASPLMWTTQMEFEIQGLYPCRTVGIAHEVGDEAFFLLDRAESGSYKPIVTFDIAIYAIQPRVPRTVNWYEPTDEAQFSRQITDFVKRPPQSPTTFYPLPYTAPLWITTKSGANYLLPLDWGEPHWMSEAEVIWARAQQRRGCSASDGPDCIATSYKSLVTLCKTTPCIPDAYHDPLNIDHRKTLIVNPIVPGDAFIFSPTGLKLAVWRDKELQIYNASPLEYQRKLIASRPIRTAPNSPGKAIWSQDGRYLAYSDVQGLWLWDLNHTDSDPRLLIPVGDLLDPGRMPIPLHFSAQGRYLLVEENKLSFTLDTITGNRFPGGVVSPDESRLLTFLSEPEADFCAEVCAFGHLCGMGISSLEYQVRQPVWLSNSDYAYLLCNRIRAKPAKYVVCGAERFQEPIETSQQ